MKRIWMLVKMYRHKRKKYRHASRGFCPEIIFDDIQWFNFQVIMLYIENIMNRNVDIYIFCLKVSSMFNIKIWYDERIFHKISPDDVGIMYINCGKVIFCSL